MITPQQMRKIIAFSKREAGKNDKVHGWPHIVETVRIARFLAKREHADARICIAASYLHDISKRREPKVNHGTNGSKRARVFLKSIGVDDAAVSRICWAIFIHNKGGPKKTIEAKILYDADKLQDSGSGIIGRGLWYMLTVRRMTMEDSMRRLEREYHFYMTRLNTRTGKRIYRKRDRMIKAFFADYRKNWWK